MKFMLVSGAPRSLVNFRGPLIDEILSLGYEVVVVSPDIPSSSPYREVLEGKGCKVTEIPLKRTGLNPVEDISAFLYLLLIVFKEKPDYFMAYTIKPVIYGVLAAWLCGVKNKIALITGLGYSFTGEAIGLRGFIRAVTRCFYRFSLSKADKVFFQNPDDERLFYNMSLIPDKATSYVVNGSGVDVDYFSVSRMPTNPCFLLIARLLGDKGIREYAKAADFLKPNYPNAIFYLVGWADDNPDAISKDELNEWIDAGNITYLGKLEDVRPAIIDCSIYVLPSYREGTPRTVLEAMAMGRPVITTNAPGCKETVVDGVNGILIEPKSVDSLVVAMEALLNDPVAVERMGAESRKIAEEKYDVNKVNASMLKDIGVFKL